MNTGRVTSTKYTAGNRTSINEEKDEKEEERVRQLIYDQFAVSPGIKLYR